MADNFLEKHYQEYQARKASMGSGIKTATKKKTNLAKLKKSVLITDGCSSIGSALVLAFCNEECKVAFCDSDKEKGLQLAKETGSAFFHLAEGSTEDLGRTIDALSKRWGGIDILILHSAQPFTQKDSDSILGLFDEAVSQTIRPYVTATDAWLKQHQHASESPTYGRVILICPAVDPTAGRIPLNVNLSCKGIAALTQTLDDSLLHQGVTINSIHPEWEETADNPTGVANLCVFLTQTANGGIHGNHFKVQGIGTALEQRNE